MRQSTLLHLYKKIKPLSKMWKISLTSILVIFIYLILTNKNHTEINHDANNIKILVKESFIQNHTPKLVVFGSSEIQNNIEIRSDISGRISKIEVSDGNDVLSGDPIISIIPKEQSTLLMNAQARLQKSQDKLSNEIREAQKQLDEVKNYSKFTTMRAPFSGRIEKFHVKEGDMVDRGDILSSLISKNPIIIKSMIPENHISQIFPNQLAYVKINALNKSFEGRIKYISYIADPLTRNFMVETLIHNNEESYIQNGLTAEVSIDLASIDVHEIPASALIIDNDGNIGVNILTNENIVNFVKTQIIDSDSEKIWINNLPEKSKIVIMGQNFLTNGQKIDEKNFVMIAGNNE